MTTIVINLKKMEVAFDHRSTNTIGCVDFVEDNFVKCWKEGNLHYVATGSIESIDRFLRSVRNGKTPKWKGNKEATVVSFDENGEFRIYETYRKSILKLRRWKQVTYQRSRGFLTFGSGGSYAAAILLCTSNTRKAMTVAGKLDMYTSKSYSLMTLKDGAWTYENKFNDV